MGGDENCTIRWLKENYSEHFERLYKMMYKRLYLFARNFLMDEELADDIVQEDERENDEAGYSIGAIFVYFC